MSGDIVERLRVDCDCYDGDTCVHAAARDEIVRLRAEVDLKGYRLDDALAEIERLRALITEWDTALQALRVATDHWGEADWDGAYDRWDASEKALTEEARRG